MSGQISHFVYFFYVHITSVSNQDFASFVLFYLDFLLSLMEICKDFGFFEVKIGL